MAAEGELIPKTHGGARPGSGRKMRVLTDAEIKTLQGMSAVGCSIRQIANVLHMDEANLSERYRDEIDKYRAQAVAKVAQSLYVAATEKDDRTAQIFFLKSIGGWRDNTQPEVAGLLNIHIHLDGK
jgi:hypothetical protein